MNDYPLHIDVRSVKDMLEAGEDFLLLDCREQNEYDLVRIDGSRLIPLGEVPSRLEELEGKAVQDALESYFGRGKKKKKFSVEFQNVENTNALLAQNDINYKNIDTYTIKQLSEILEVDGIISGNLDLNVLLSRGVPDDVSFIDYLLGDSNYGRIGIKISDGKTGKLLWKYENEITKKSGRNTTDLIDKMMKKMTRRFPYDKERIKTRKRT